MQAFWLRLDSESKATLTRFSLRMIGLVIWTIILRIRISLMIEATGVLMSSFCVLVALYRGERLMRFTLNHWDEAVWFTVLAYFSHLIEHHPITFEAAG